MKVYLYGMRHRARDNNNYLVSGYIRDLFLEEMTYDMRDEYYNVLCYINKLDEDIISKYGYEFVSVREIDDE